ncbi:MAG: Fe-S cluster assembly ATPase SufC [Eubacteriales bacterium]|nr:Fe-S cluster assembly ATPase SufC [Eubacteriales bacterium]
MASLLEVKDLAAGVEDKEILHGVNLSIGEGEVHVILGPNGSGKSTLSSVIMGDPRYTVNRGQIWFDGEKITDLTTDKRALKGMFISFQSPVEVPGITLRNFIRSSVEQRTGKRIRLWDFRKEMEKVMDVLQMDYSYADRDLNVGFSGGEKKKAEILQLLMLKPKFAILDETDSGLDVDAVRTVSKGIEEYKRSVGGALMIITHSTQILQALDVDQAHILAHGQIIHNGGRELVDEVNRNGFEQFLKAEAK